MTRIRPFVCKRENESGIKSHRIRPAESGNFCSGVKLACIRLSN